jgi:hypothetical protein
MSAAQRGALENAIATLRSQSPIADANFAVFDRNPDSGSTLTIAVMADANFEKMSGITKTAQAVTDANGQHLGKDGTLYQDAIVVIRESAIQPFTKTRYYSANKQYFVEVTKNGRAALYRARRRRPSQLVWIRKLKILPAKLIVTSDGRRVATIDRYYGNGGNPTMPAVILLNEEGYEIASYALSEVANLARVIQTTSSAQWYGTATLSADEKELVINTEVSKRDRATCDHIRSSEHTYECARSVPYEELHFSMITGGMTRMRV